jgi:hypothetical protein
VESLSSFDVLMEVGVPWFSWSHIGLRMSGKFVEHFRTLWNVLALVRIDWNALERFWNDLKWHAIF